ncbi:MAG: hypothetical protein V3T77_11355 [Planctomycetota bacterium]
MSDWSIRTRDPERGRIETEWRQDISQRTQGLLFRNRFQERNRLTVSIRPHGPFNTRVRVFNHREERPPGGAEAFRWGRLDASPELVKALMARIQKILKEGQRLLVIGTLP